MDHVHRARVGREGGRDPDALECIVGAPSKVTDDLAAAREEVRWFPAMVSNHVMDLIERYGWDSDIPSELTDFVKRGRATTTRTTRASARRTASSSPTRSATASA